MNSPSLLDVTVLEPRERHSSIFSRYDELKPGMEMIIINDHDPKPLYYQLLNDRGNEFSWEYMEKGPETWKVKIIKRLPDKQTVTLGQLAARDFRQAQIFKKYGINFCCGGKKTLAEACVEKNLDIETIEKELLSLNSHDGPVQLNYNDWQPGFIIDFIINNHHRYVKRSLAPLQELACKVAKSHGNKNPELFEIAVLFKSVALELDQHILREEEEVFPYIRALLQQEETGGGISEAHLSVSEPLKKIEIEHELVEGKMQAIHELTHSYRIPPGACASYTLLLKWLREFETDLHHHMHLENNILFPRAIETAKS